MPVRLPWRLVAVVALLASGCGAIVELEPGDPVAFVQQPQTSKILSREGRVVAELHAEQDREDVALDAVAPALVRAVVAVEDRRFFLHAGVDAAAIARAAVSNLEAGGVAEGGSTITQQYVKNTMTGPARTLDRKLREAALAFQLEQRYGKAEILERYLNTVYFGRGAYGIHAAARRFFGVAPADLTVAQSALLAGLVQSPSRHDPYDNPESALVRRQVVLDAMVDTGALEREEAEAVAAEPLGLAPLPTDDRVAAPYVVDEVKRLVQHDPDGRFSALGETVDERVDALFTGGLRIFATLDLRVQELADRAVRSILTEPDDPRAAVAVLDPRSGAVRALVGGRDYYDVDDPDARFDLATQGRRQPGSAFKPLVLATALERGVSLDREFPGGSCVAFERVPGWDDGVCNYGGTSYGPLTLREATVRSVNTVYARLAVELGPTTLLQGARQLGVRGELPEVHALALGAGEVTPLDLASAYQPFADLGRRHPPYLIDRIETADGEVLYEHVDESYEVLDPAVAYVVTDTLEQVVARGTGVRAAIDRPQAGKTGTSQDNADAWFVGYTPDLLAAVWVGYPAGRVPMRPPTTREVVEGGRWPAEIWRALMEPAHADIPVSDFAVPEVDLVRVEVDATRNCLPNPYTPADVIEVREYLAGSEPTERCTEPTGPPVDDVPDVVGLPAEVAQDLLEEQGFVVDVRPIAATLYPPGFVERQRPAPGGTTLESDDHAVVVWVSARPEARIPVPNVVGLPLEDAVAALEADGWVVDVREACPEDGCPPEDEATVWAQSPGPGERADRYAVVTIVVPPS